MGRRLLILFLTLFAAALTGTAASSDYVTDFRNAGLEYGLSVVTYPSAPQDFTRLALEEGKPIPLHGKTLEMSFDLYNRPENVFGCIFRMITDKGENVDLMYTADLQDARKLILVTGDQVHFIGTEIPMEQWLPVRISLNPRDGGIDLVYGEEAFSVRDAGTKGAKSFRISFGLCQLTGYTLGDVASVNVRNICLNLGGKPFRRWELARHSGDICYDRLKGVPARAVNPQWMIDSYVSFRPVFSHSFEDIPSVTFDDRDKFYMTCGDAPIHVFSVLDGSLTEIPVKGGYNPANYPNQLFYVAGGHDWLTAYNLDEGLFSKFDFETGRWENEKYPELDHYFWNNTNAWEPHDHALYSFGGYGHYHYRNELIVSYLDAPEKSFRKTVEDITPRYAATSYIVDSLMYVFGGRGNPSGKQELSPKNYYDLYTINTHTLEVNKLWEMKSVPYGDFVSGENFVYNWENGDFYLLAGMQGFTLLRLRPEAPGIERMSLPIPWKRNAQYTYLNLWHSYEQQKMYAVILQAQVDSHTDVDVYEIDYPPLPVSSILQEEYEEPVQKSKNGRWWKVLLALAGVALIVDYVWFRFLPNRKPRRRPDMKEASGEREDSYEPEHRYYDFSRSSVIFFGGFRVTDREGNDVTAQFTPTVKALLLLLIVSTARSGGIASQKINHLLWSYKPDDTANNNRNVYMSKLRGLLEGVGDIRIQNQNKLWSISFEGDTQCDYLEALRLFQDGAVGAEDVDRLLELLLKGQMLPNTELDWIDEYKSAFSNATIDFLCRQLRRGDLSDKTLLQAANTIFQHDFLNEDALQAKVRILCRENKPGLAKTIYDNFCKEYRKSLGIEYTVPFKEMIGEV